MRPLCLCLSLILAILALSCTPANGHHVSGGNSDLSYKQNLELLRREKRQLEDFDNEFAPSAKQEEQEEPGFWDRVVKMAMKLFSRFVEWLNT